MLLDGILPEYQFVSRRQRLVKAPIDRVWTCILTSDFASLPIIRVLVRVRGIKVARPEVHSLMKTVHAHGFIELAVRQYQEIVIGGIAKPWQAGGGIVPGLDAESFSEFKAPGTCASLLNLALKPATAETTLVTTETRVQALSDYARRRFRVYWTLVRLPSRAIRSAMLRDVAKRAEGRS